ncbi:MAG: glycosyltransferase family 2 protein [Brevinema sp.]
MRIYNKEIEITKVLVIIATYHIEKHIARAINSIIIQTFNDWELIIINEFGSNDNTEKIVDKYNDPCIKFIQNTEKRLDLGFIY